MPRRGSDLVLRTAVVAAAVFAFVHGADAAAAERSGSGSAVVVAEGPPAWAPAHGYRRKAGGPRTLPASYPRQRPSYCRRETVGAAAGAAAGAALGQEIGEGRAVATAAGAALGALIGGAIGRHLDGLDQDCVARILSVADDRQRVVFHGEAGLEVSLTLIRTFRAADGRPCRDYWASAIVDGRPREMLGTACREPNGRWHRPS